MVSGAGEKGDRHDLSCVGELARPAASLTPEQRLLLDSWRRSGLPAGDFGPLVGVSKHPCTPGTASWKRKAPPGWRISPAAGPGSVSSCKLGGPLCGSAHSEKGRRAAPGLQP